MTITITWTVLGWIAYIAVALGTLYAIFVFSDYPWWGKILGILAGVFWPAAFVGLWIYNFFTWLFE